MTVAFVAPSVGCASTEADLSVNGDWNQRRVALRWRRSSARVPREVTEAQTREIMQTELLRIWEEQRQTSLFITHSIHEAVFLSDRVIVLSLRPGRILKDIRIDLPRPRTVREVRSSRQFNEHVIQLGEVMGVV